MMFRGGSEATIDEKGRVKIPAKFRTPLIETFGPRLYITSWAVPSVRIYPITEWEKIERIMRDSGRANDPRVRRFLWSTSIYGDEQEIDGQGRILIPPRLRKFARMEGEVIVCGYPTNELEIWNESLFHERFGEEPMSEADQSYISDLIKEGSNAGVHSHSSDETGDRRDP
jgi:MraZ protein